LPEAVENFPIINLRGAGCKKVFADVALKFNLKNGNLRGPKRLVSI
jgi:hypothetical protein